MSTCFLSDEACTEKRVQTGPSQLLRALVLGSQDELLRTLLTRMGFPYSLIWFIILQA